MGVIPNADHPLHLYSEPDENGLLASSGQVKFMNFMNKLSFVPNLKEYEYEMVTLLFAQHCA